MLIKLLPDRLAEDSICEETLYIPSYDEQYSFLFFCFFFCGGAIISLVVPCKHYAKEERINATGGGNKSVTLNSHCMSTRSELSLYE